MFRVSKHPLVLPSYSSHHLVVSNCPRWHRKQQQQGLFCCQNMLLFDKEETVGTYKELRKKKMQLKRSNFYYSCRKAHALRSRAAADTFYISSSACALAHKVCKFHFRVLQQENCLQLLASNKEESRLPYKINFYVVIYSLTSLIGNKDKTIEKKHRLEIHMCITSVPMYWEHWKQRLICHAPASMLLWAAALKPVSHLPHLQHRALLLCHWSCQMSHPVRYTAPSRWHSRTQGKPGASTAAGRFTLPCRPCICRDPHPATSHKWDLAEPCPMNHLLHPMLCKSTLDWKAQFVFPCAAIFHFYPSSTAESRGTQRAKPQTTGLRCGVWGLSKPAGQTGSLIKHLPQLLQKSVTAREGLSPQHPSHWATLEQQFPFPGHFTLNSFKHTQALSAVSAAKSITPSSSIAFIRHRANTPLSAIPTRGRFPCSTGYFCGMLPSLSNFSQG